MAIALAEWRWGVELTPTGHPDLPLMGPDGCTAPPHLRPACSGHLCDETAQKMGPEYLELKAAISHTEVEAWAAPPSPPEEP